MRRFSTVRIDRPTRDIWPVLADVQSWPGWTPTMREVRLLDATELVVGAHVRVRQPRLPTLTWTVEEVVPGRSFSWITGPSGGRTRATHDIEAIDDHTSRVTLALEQQGLAVVFGLLSARMTQRYLDLEGTSLRTVCERAADPAADPGADPGAGPAVDPGEPGGMVTDS